MKKIYALAFGVILSCGFTASAQEIADTFSEKELSAEFASVLKTDAANGVVSVKAPVASATALSDIAGTYTWRFKAPLTGASGRGRTAEIVITAKEGSENEVTITGLASGFEVSGTVDAEAGIISIPRTSLALDNGKFKIFESYVWPSTGLVALDAPIELYYNKGYITTAPGILLGTGLHTEDMSEAADGGYYALTVVNSFWPEFQWIELGATTFTDTFFGPMFGKAGEAVDVKVYRASEGLDVFKIENAFASFGEGTAPMLIDATIPECVIIPVQDSQVEATGRGTTWYANFAAISADPTSLAEDQQSTYKDGVITIAKGTCRWNWADWTGNEGNFYYSTNENQANVQSKFPTITAMLQLRELALRMRP